MTTLSFYVKFRPASVFQIYDPIMSLVYCLRKMRVWWNSGGGRCPVAYFLF